MRHETVKGMLQAAGVDERVCEIKVLPMHLESNCVTVKVKPKGDYPWKIYKFFILQFSVKYPE